jgi:hypothetical protein
MLSRSGILLFSPTSFLPLFIVIREIHVALHTIAFPPLPIEIASDAAQIRFVRSVKYGSIISYLTFICSSNIFFFSSFGR